MRASAAARRQLRTARLLLRARAVAPEDRETYEKAVVELHLPLAGELARRYRGRGIADEDLQQVAYLGLVKAVHGYDPTRGHDFVGYAVPTILGELRRGFRDTGWTVRPPRSLQELVVRLPAAEAELLQRLGRTPSEAEVAELLGVAADDVRAARGVAGCFRTDSLDEPLGDGDDSPASSTLGEPDPGFDHADARMALAAAIGVLDPRERAIVSMRFFEGRTQADIGAVLGVSQEQVSRLLSGILRRLRAEMDRTGAA
ncbi:sigma-70 family RNA polymerase sigma factor [Nocardioides sp. GY 10127]|uniref:sigma-70 family RNA polymerase sigma factor n=1 Tax=Nocardioides sp. GY 10127 TaxID=2569762 RepID=UPI0014589AE7|nr:sigma-70 family RNA polymerase sigma factor [Nocardioides sp. GY 10127]